VIRVNLYLQNPSGKPGGFFYATAKSVANGESIQKVLKFPIPTHRQGIRDALRPEGALSNETLNLDGLGLFASGHFFFPNFPL
jgi:hypothetical protein